jgi:hypothetical protein
MKLLATIAHTNTVVLNKAPVILATLSPNGCAI